MSHDDGKQRLNNCIEYSKESESSTRDVFELKYTIDQQQRFVSSITLPFFPTSLKKF